MNRGDRHGVLAAEDDARAAMPWRNDPLDLIKVPEAARRYPIGTKRLCRLIREGAIPAVVIDTPVRKRILVHPQAVEAWLRAQERRQTPSPEATR